MTSFLQSFLPELVLLVGALGVFGTTLKAEGTCAARNVAMFTALLAVLACAFSMGSEATLFSGAYRIDAFSQWLKLVILGGFTLVLVLSRELPDIREHFRPEYFLFLTLSVIGQTFMMSSIDVIALVIALELSSFPLYIMVAMRRERDGQRLQMESAVKYIMFGVAANGIMLFGLSYLFGLTGTTNLPLMMARLAPQLGSPIAVIGLSLSLAGLLYKLAVFPFHFWTPDVYQGASNETTGMIASLPKLGAVAILVRFTALVTPDNAVIPTLLGLLATCSMFYGNLVALVQDDFKRLLGFSGIAHAGYAIVGFAALGAQAATASLFYISGYILMVLACFVVITRVSKDGANLSISELAGLHKRSPLLALTLIVAVFALAGIPPFVGFAGKFSILSAALAQHRTALVVLMVINSAIAVYYYLRVIKEAVFGEPKTNDAIALDLPTRVLCTVLIVGILGLGVLPEGLLSTIKSSLATVGF